MRRWQLGLGLLAVVLSFVPLSSTAHASTSAAGKVTLDRWVSTTGADFAAGMFEGTAVFTATGDGEIRLQEGSAWGTYTSAPWELPTPGRAAGLLFQGQVADAAAVSFELRGQDEAGEWTAWAAMPIGPWAEPAGLRAGETLVEFPARVQQLQYRATFSGDNASPVVEAVVVVTLGVDGATSVRALAPWEEADGRPHPVPPERWGAEAVPTTVQTATIAPSQVVILPATWADAGAEDASSSLRMLQHFQREVFAWDDFLYSFLVDPQGRLYEGRQRPAGDVLYIGLLGANPHDPVSATAEDSLVALLDWWTAALPGGRAGVSVVAPIDPLLAERIQARRAVQNLRRNEWFLARGTVSPETDEWILVTNPEAQRIRVTTELYRGGSRLVRRTARLAASSRMSLLADALVTPGSLWARITGDSGILVERAIYYGYEGDDSTGLDSLSREWYLPAGTAEAGFSTTLTLLNPGKEAITATVTVYAQSGPAAEKAVPVAPLSRLDVPLREVYSGTTPAGTRVLSSGLLAVEQEVRFAGGQAGYGLPGTALLSRRWTFAGVETAGSSLTLLALLNPYTTSVKLTLTLMSEDGTTLRRPYTLAPGEQLLNLNTLLPDLALAAEVQSEQPIAAARVTFFNESRAAQATLGAVRPARQWYLPEGATGEPFESFLLVANSNDVPTTLDVTFLGATGELGTRHFSMPAHARLTVPLNEVLPDVGGFSTLVLSDWPVVVERSMFLHERQGGHACLGIAR